MIQWLRLRTSNAGNMGSISGQGTKIPHTLLPKKKKKVHIVGDVTKEIFSTLRMYKYLGEKQKCSRIEVPRSLPILGTVKNMVSR